MPDIPYGDFVEITDGGQKYFLARLGDVYSCTCPAWKEQTIAEHRRTCSHLEQYCGEKAERNRINPQIEKSKNVVKHRKLFIYNGSSEVTLEDLVEVMTELDVNIDRADKYSKLPLIYFRGNPNAYLEVTYYRDPERSNYTKGDPRPVVMIISKICFVQEENESESLNALVRTKLRKLGFRISA
jgi:hypothetical protein